MTEANQTATAEVLISYIVLSRLRLDGKLYTANDPLQLESRKAEKLIKMGVLRIAPAEQVLPASEDSGSDPKPVAPASDLEESDADKQAITAHDYSALTVPVLKTELGLRDIAFAAGALKDDLIKLLVADDAAKAESTTASLSSVSSGLSDTNSSVSTVSSGLSDAVSTVSSGLSSVSSGLSDVSTGLSSISSVSSGS